MSSTTPANERDSHESDAESSPGESGSDSDMDMEQEVPPSELGTKAYWDKYYETGIKHFTTSGIRDDGWFGQGCRKRVIQYLTQTSKPKTSRILDLGCGNGEMITLLVENGWTNVTGYDYSEPAITLCKMIFKDNSEIDLKVADLTEDITSSHQFDICLDKGTFDAISINPDKSRDQCTSAYFRNVQNLLSDDGILIITSCNWTEDEMIEMAKNWLELKERIPCGSNNPFSFGGKSGTPVYTVVLQKFDAESSTSGSESDTGMEVPPSEVETKEYWDQCYERQLKLYERSGARESGWLGNGCRKRVIEYLAQTSKPKTSLVLDLGCGNGRMITSLVENGWTNLSGYDYSEPAISLCKMIFKDKPGIEFQVADLTEEITSSHQFDICLDKGTFDSISTNPLPEKSRSQRTNAYFQNAQNLLSDDGILIISTWKWKEDEMIQMAKNWFELKDRVPCESSSKNPFSFGSTSGKSVFTVVLKNYQYQKILKDQHTMN